MKTIPNGPKEASAVTTTSPVSEIVQLHGEILSAARTSLDTIRIGELLTQEKAQLNHGHRAALVGGDVCLAGNADLATWGNEV